MEGRHRTGLLEQCVHLYALAVQTKASPDPQDLTSANCRWLKPELQSMFVYASTQVTLNLCKGLKHEHIYKNT